MRVVGVGVAGVGSSSEYKDTGAPGHKGTRVQGHKGRRVQGYKGTRVQGHKGTRVQIVLSWKQVSLTVLVTVPVLV